MTPEQIAQAELDMAAETIAEGDYHERHVVAATIRAIAPADVLEKVGQEDVLPTAVAVNPLEWVGVSAEFWRAVDLSGGHYEVLAGTHSGGYVLHTVNGCTRKVGGCHANDRAAKAAAQADYEARILSAVTDTPQPEPDAVAQLLENADALLPTFLAVAARNIDFAGPWDDFDLAGGIMAALAACKGVRDE